VVQPLIIKVLRLRADDLLEADEEEAHEERLTKERNG
jgi:hypothetical protein